MEELDAILNDERYQTQDIKGRREIRNSFYDAEIEAGRMDAYDRVAENGLLDLSTSYHSDTGPQKERIQAHYNLYKDFKEELAGADKTTRAVAAQRFFNKHASLERAQKSDRKDNAETQALLAVIQLGDPKEIELRKDKRGFFKGQILDWIGSEAESIFDLAGKAVSTNFGAATGNRIGDVEAFAEPSPREGRKRDAAAAKETLREKGLDDKEIETLLRDFDHDTMDFHEDHKQEPFRMAKSGEVIFNNEALLRMSSEDLSIRLHHSDLSEAAKDRALARLHMQKNDAIVNFHSRAPDPYFLDSIDEREGTWEERIDSYLTDVEGQSGMKKVGVATLNNINASVSAMLGGTVGFLAGKTEWGREFSKFTEDLSSDMWQSNQELDQGWLGKTTAELLGLVPDMVVAKGAGTVFKALAKSQKLKAITKARVAKPGWKLQGSEKAKWAMFEENMVKGGVSLGSGYSAGTRVVNSALAQVDENGEPAFEYGEAVMFGFKQVLITGLVTRVGAGSGTERFLTGAAFKREARKFWKDYVKKDILYEGLEESIDELVSGMLVSRDMNPDMTTEEIVDQALHAFVLGTFMGGTTNLPTPIGIGLAKIKKYSAPGVASLPTGPVNLGKPTAHDGGEDPATAHDGGEDPARPSSVLTETIVEQGGDGMEDKATLIPQTTAALGSVSPSLQEADPAEGAAPTTGPLAGSQGPNFGPEFTVGEVKTGEDIDQRDADYQEWLDGMDVPELGQAEIPLDPQHYFGKNRKTKEGVTVTLVINRSSGQNADGSWSPITNAHVLVKNPDGTGGVVKFGQADFLKGNAKPLGQSRLQKEGDVASPQSKEGAEPGSKSKPLERNDLVSLRSRALEQAQKEDKIDGGSVMADRVEKLEDRHRELTSELNKLDENDKSGRRVIENELVDIENSLRRVAREALVDTSGVTPEVQAKYDKWIASRVKEIQDKLANKEPITKEDRDHWIEAGMDESALPHPDLDTETDFSERGGGPDESAGLRKPAAAQAPPTPQAGPAPQTTPAPQAGPTPTPKTQTASTKPPVKRPVDPKTGEVDVGEGVKLKTGPDAPSIAQQIFGDPAASKETVTGSVHIDRVSVKKGKDGKKRVYIDEQVTDQIASGDGTFTTDKDSKSTLTAALFHAGKRAVTKETGTPPVESTQEAGESSTKTEGPLKSPSKQFIEDGKGSQKGTRRNLVAKGGGKDLDILAGDSPVEAVEGSPRGGQYNPKTRKVEIDPNQTSDALFRQSTLPRISAEKAALTGKTPVKETTEALNQEVVSRVLGHRLSDLTPEQRTKLFIVEALMGNKEAQAELLRVAGAKGADAIASQIKGVVKEIETAKKGEGSQKVLDRELRKLRKHFYDEKKITLGSPEPKKDAPKKKLLGSFRVSPVIFNALKVIRKELGLGRAAIDSGTADSKNRITEVLEVGAIIRVSDGEGGILKAEQWKVTEHHTNPDGSIRMELRKMALDNEGVEAELADYHDAPATRAAIMSAMKEFRKLDPSDRDLKDSRKLLRGLIKDALSRMTSAEYADSKLVFQSGDEVGDGPLSGRLMAVTGVFKDGKYVDTKILVNEDVWHERLYDWAKLPDGSNEAANRSAASDFADSLNSTLFEEVAHDHALQKLDRAEVAAMTRDMIELARKDDGARAELLKWRSYQLGHPGANVAELDAMWAELEELADKAETDPRSSPELHGEALQDALQEQAEASEKLNEESLMIGHEMLAGFVQLIKTGATTHDMSVMNHRWIGGWLSHETASPASTLGGDPNAKTGRKKSASKKVGPLRSFMERRKSRIPDASAAAERETVIGRLLEMASRAFEVVQNYMKVHQTLNDLPPAVKEQVDKLAATLDSESVKAPDPFNIHHRALMQGKNNIDQNRAMIESDDSDLFDAQQTLRDVLFDIGSLGGVEAGGIIRLEWISGDRAELVVRSEVKDVIPKDLLAKLQVALDPINESGRPTAIAKNAASTHGIQLVMRRLGITQGELVDQDAESLREARGQALADAKSRVADALGINVDDLVETLSKAHEQAVEDNLAIQIASIPTDLPSLDVSHSDYLEAGAKMTAARDLVARLTEVVRSLESKDSDLEKEDLDVARSNLDEAEWDLFVMEQDARGFRPRADTEFLPSPKDNYKHRGGISRPGDFVPSTGGPMYANSSVRAVIKNYDDALTAWMIAADGKRAESPSSGFRTFGQMLETFERDRDRARNSRSKFNPFSKALESKELKVPYRYQEVMGTEEDPDPEPRAMLPRSTLAAPHIGPPALGSKSPLEQQEARNLVVNRDKAIEALEEAMLMRDTIDGLMEVEKEMVFALLGGPKPRRLRQRKASGQDDQPININLTLGASKDVRVPADIAHVVRGALSELLERGAEGHAGKDLVGRVEGKRDERAGERIARLVELSDIMNEADDSREYLAARSELSGLMKDLKSIGLKTQFEDGKGTVLSITFESSLPDEVFEHTTKSGESLEALVEELGKSLLAGERASFSLVGVDQLLVESDRAAQAVANREPNMMHNARVEAERLSRQWVARHAQGDSKVDNTVTGGFPFEVEEVPVLDDDGKKIDEIRRFLPRADWFDIPRYEPTPVDPDAKYDGNRELLDLVAKGEVGEVILEVASRLDAMESSSTVSDQAVLSHEYGLTPAGFVHQLVANPYTALLVRLKGTKLSRLGNRGKMEQVPVVDLLVEAALAEGGAEGEAKADRIKAIFNGLAPGIENDASRWGNNNDSAKAGKSHRGFTDFRVLLRVGNEAYRQTMKSLVSDRATRETIREGKTSDDIQTDSLTFGIDLGHLTKMDRDNRVGMALRQRHENQNENSILSLIVPDRAHLLLDYYHRYSPRSVQLRIGSTEGREVVRGELDNPQETLGATSIEAMGQDRASIAKELQNEQEHFNLMAKLRGVALMELNGGSMERVLRLVNSEEYATITVLPNGDVKMGYAWDKIDSDIMHQLANFAEKEAELGVVKFEGTRIGGEEGTIDTRLKEMVEDEGAMDYPDEYILGLVYRPDFEGMPVRDEVSQQGGTTEISMHIAHFNPEWGVDKPHSRDEFNEDNLDSWARFLGVKANFGLDPDAPESAKDFVEPPLSDIADLRKRVVEAYDAHIAGRPMLNKEGKALSAALQSGGRASRYLPSDPTDLEKMDGLKPGHTATAWSVLETLTSQVPEITLIKGEAHEGREDDVPSVAFIGTEDDPVIVFPFRYWSMVKGEDVHRVTKEIMVYIAKRNGTDLVEQATSLLKPLVDAHNNDAAPRLVKHFVNQAEEAAEAKWGRPLTPTERYMVVAEANTAWEAIKELIRIQLKEMTDGDGAALALVWGDPARAEGAIADMRGESDGEHSDAAIDTAADIITTFLTSDPLKRILGMSSVGLDIKRYPNHPNHASMGSIMSADLMMRTDGSDLRQFELDQASETGGIIQALLEVGAAEDIEGMIQDNSARAFFAGPDGSMVDSHTGDTLPTGDESHRMGKVTNREGHNNFVVWRVLADGADQADNLLVNTTIELDRKFDKKRRPSGLKVEFRPKDGEESQLTEFEATQLIALFSADELRAIGGKLEKPMTLGMLPDDFTVPELQQWNAQAAGILRSRFRSIARTHGGYYDIFQQWDRVKGSGYVTGGNSNDKRMQTNRLNSGMLAVVRSLGVRRVENPGENPGEWRLDVTGNYDNRGEALREKLREAGVPTTIPNPEAERMTYLDKLRTKALGEDPSLAGDALYEAISILAQTGKSPSGSVDIGIDGNRPNVIKRVLRDFDTLENVEEIDLVTRAVLKMESESETNEGHLEEFRKLVLENTSRSKLLKDALSQLKEIRQDEIDAPSAEAFLKMVNEGEAWNALSSIPGARNSLENIVNTFFGGPEELLNALADHLISLDESGAIGVRNVRMGVARGEEQPGLPFDSAERLPLEPGEDRVTRSSIDLWRGVPHRVTHPGGEASFRGADEVVYLVDLVSEQGAPHFQEKQSRVLDQIDEFERTYGVTPQKAVGILAELVKEHNRVRHGLSGRKTNAVLLGMIETQIIKIATGLNKWVDKTTRVVDAEFGVGVLSQVTQLRRHNKISPLPVDIGLLIEQARDMTLIKKIGRFYLDAKAVTDPKYLAKRLQDSQISQSLQAFVDSSKHGSRDPIHGDLAGSIVGDTPEGFLSKSAAGAGIPINRASLQALLRDSRGRSNPDRREMIIQSLRAQMSQDIGYLYRDISQELQRETAKLKEEFIRDKGVVPDLLDRLNNGSLLENGLTRTQVMDAQIRALEAAIALDRAVTDEELTSMVHAEQKNVERSREFKGKFSSFRGGAYFGVRLEGQGEEVELTQRVLADVAKIHSDLYSENRRAGKMGKAFKEHEGKLVPDEIELVEDANTFADEQLIMMEQFRVALGEEAGVEYSVVGDLLIPANIDDRIRKILDREDDEKKKGWKPKVFTPDSIRFSKKKKEIELYASSSDISDYSDFSDGESVLDGESVSAKEYDDGLRARATKVVLNLVNKGALVYGVMTSGQKKAGKNLQNDYMENAKALPTEMISYMWKMQAWLKTVNNTAMGYDSDSIDRMKNFRRRVDSFMKSIGATNHQNHDLAVAKYNKAKKKYDEDPDNNTEPEEIGKFEEVEVSPEDISHLFSIYTESKALITGRKQAEALTSGYVSGKMLIDTGEERKLFNRLMHTDGKIRKIFAKTVGAQRAAQRVGGWLEYGLSLKGGVTGGREGHKSQVDDIQTALGKIAPKRLKILGMGVVESVGKDRHWSETVDFEMSSQGYVGEMINSILSEGDNVSTQAQIVLDMFAATDKAYFESDKKLGQIRGTNRKALNNQDIYRQQRKRFTKVLEAIVQKGEGQVAADAQAMIRGNMDKAAVDYGRELSDLMGHMMVVYQAQSQLIPRSEHKGGEAEEVVGGQKIVDRHSFTDGNARLLPKNIVNGVALNERGMQGGMPSRWQRVILGEKEMEGDDALLHETVSMRGAAFLKKPKDGMEGDDGRPNVLDIDGVGAPLAIMDDMAYRMHVSVALALSQEFTGVAKDPSKRGMVVFHPDHQGFFATHYTDKTPEHKKMREIGLSLASLAQEIVFNDTRRMTPKTATQEFMDASNIVGMASALISFRQLAFQTVPAIMGYATFRGGLAGNWGVIPIFWKQAMGAVEGLPLADTLTEHQFFSAKRQASRIGRFMEKHTRGLFMRTADGQVEAESHLLGANPRVSSRTAAFSRRGKPLHGFEKKVTNYMWAMSKGVSDGTLGMAKLMMRNTIAKAEEVAIRSIFMNEVVKGVQEAVDLLDEGHGYKNVTLKGVLDGDYDGFLTPSILEPARIIAIDILGQSDSSRKGSAFQRRDTVGGELWRGSVVTFANHLLSTAANSHASAAMMYHGRDTKEDLTKVKRHKERGEKDGVPYKKGDIIYDSSGKPVMETVEQKRSAREGAALLATNVGQNVAYRLMDQAFVTKVITNVMAAIGQGLGGWDEEKAEKKKKEWLLRTYGLEDGTENRWSKPMGWISAFLMGSRRPWGYNYREGEFSDAQRLKDKVNMGIGVTTELINQLPYLGLLASTTVGGSVSQIGLKYIADKMHDLPVFGGKRAGFTIGEGDLSGQASEDAFDRYVYWLTYAMNNHLGNRNYFFMGLNHMAQPFYHMSNAQKETSLATKLSLIPPALPFVPRDFRRPLYEEGIKGVGGFGDKADVQGWHNRYKLPKEKNPPTNPLSDYYERKSKGGGSGVGKTYGWKDYGKD